MIIILQGILIVLFLSVGIQKVLGHEQQVDTFEDLKLPQWLRTVTGWIELVGVVGLIIGFWLPWIMVLAGLWLAVTMLIALITHIRVKDPFSKKIPAIVFLALSITLIILAIPE